jgi:hypothetical protein
MVFAEYVDFKTSGCGMLESNFKSGNAVIPSKKS